MAQGEFTIGADNRRCRAGRHRGLPATYRWTLARSNHDHIIPGRDSNEGSEDVDSPADRLQFNSGSVSEFSALWLHILLFVVCKVKLNR